MKLHYFFSLALIVLVMSCSKTADPEPLPMSVTNQTAEVLSDGKVKLTGKITNFDAKRVVTCGFQIQNEFGFFKEVSIPSPGTETFEITIEGLAPVTAHTFMSFFTEASATSTGTYTRYATGTKAFDTGFPNVTSVSQPAQVSDFTVVTINGSDFTTGAGISFYFGSKPSASAAIQYIPLIAKSATGEKFEGYLPRIGANGKNIPAFFEGAIQPSAIYMGNQQKTQIKKIADINYTYLFSLPTKTGKPNDVFTVTIFYARQASLDNVEVYFGDTKLTITGKTFVEDLAVGSNWIEGYQLKCQVPAGASVGSNKIKVVSPFGEEFIPNSSGDQFTVN